MSKLTDIPDRVMIEAEAVNDAIFRIAHDEVHIMGHTDRKTVIARAILAAGQREREACAQEAEIERRTDLAIKHGYKPAWLVVSYEIAAAIRNRTGD